LTPGKPARNTTKIQETAANIFRFLPPHIRPMHQMPSNVENKTKIKPKGTSEE
jgi:hypothetical protein